MSQYSEIMGSFIRNGNYPLEANYVFDSEAALQEFYKDPINATTLHPGLLKVITGDNQQLYWVVRNGDSLEFQPFLKDVLENQEELKQAISQNTSNLNTEISDRKEVVNTLEDKVTDLQKTVTSLDSRIITLENDWYEEI